MFSRAVYRQFSFLTTLVNMIRMQKQKEEAKKEAERVAAMDVAEAENGNCDEQESKAQEGGLSLLGIGGKQIRAATGKKVGKKRTPGEIRIQKGEFDLSKFPNC